MSKSPKKPQTLAKIIEARRSDVLLWEGYKSLLLRLILVAAAGYLIFTQLFLVMQVEGNGMFPAVKDGDLVIGFRMQQDYQKNDVAAVSIDGQLLVGRIVARGGDVVSVEAGVLLVNGTPQSGEIMYPTEPGETMVFPYTVPAGHVFVLGDYRTQARDSRDFGAVPMENVEAKVITILRRRGI